MVPGPFHLWLIGGDGRNVPVDDQRHRSFKMAAILDLVSVDYLTNARVDWLSTSVPPDFFI
jgi:Fe-S cluster assembly iron-binding protein IscA